MVTWGVTEAGVDSAGATGSLSDSSPRCPPSLLEQLDPHRKTNGEEIPRQTVESYAGTTKRLDIPGRDTMVEPLDFGGQYQLTTQSELPAGSFLITTTLESTDVTDPLLAETIELFVRVDGPARLCPAQCGTELRLDERQTIRLGMQHRTDDRPPRIQIPATVAGLADGLSYMSAAHHTTGPSRSHPEFRDHPPLLTTGETLSVPSSVEVNCSQTGIVFRLPESVTDLFVAAPLAYYLGADVEVEQRETATLTAEGTSIRHEFSPLPEFQHEVATLLQRVFYLDCLLRRANPDERNTSLRDDLSLDAETIRSLSPAGRLERYLNVSAKQTDDALPDWHLSTYSHPSISRGRCLPFLLDKLSLIYLADGSEMDRRDLLDKTLTENYPTRGESSTRASVLDPNLQAGRTHAWMAPGTPIDAFKTMPKAFENRYRHREQDNDWLQITVVCNDTEMEDEHSSVAKIYRAADLPMDVTVEENLTSAQLATVFESRNDFVHFIGHCDEAGLRCPDSHLSMDSLTESRTPTFFLNACGSYDQGLSLIEKGAVAGAVTFTDVLDNHAAMVGTTFARLLSRGFSIQRALELARCRIMMGKDYAVVGDGTYALVPTLAQPVVLLVDETAGGYDVAYEVVTPQSAGGSYELPFDGMEILNGTRGKLTLETADLVSILTERSLPVIFDGRFTWSEDLAVYLDQSSSIDDD